MTDWDSNAINAIGSPWELENERPPIPHTEGAGPWDAANGDWACHCAGCEDMRDSWPETTRMWEPKPGESRSF